MPMPKRGNVPLQRRVSPRVKQAVESFESLGYDLPSLIMWLTVAYADGHIPAPDALKRVSKLWKWEETNHVPE